MGSLPPDVIHSRTTTRATWRSLHRLSPAEIAAHDDAPVFLSECVDRVEARL